MAKAKIKAVGTPATNSEYEERYRVEDALRTLKQAGEIVHDKALMAKVKKMANEKADEMRDVAQQAASLAKMGRISPKQMAKLGAR